MPVSHKHQVIFVHIPRTAGSSISQMLEICGDDNKGTLTPVRPDMLYGLQGNKVLQHLNARDIQKRLGPDVYKQYFKFTVVRNPYDRVVSEYHVRKRLLPRVKMSFSDFVLRRIPLSKKWTVGKLFQSKAERALEDQFESQYDFVHDLSGALMVDKVTKFETLEADFKPLFEKWGVKGQLPKVNTSEHKDFRSYYDKITQQAVANFYERDFKVFGYDLNL